MGCSNTKFKAEEEQVPPKIRPLIRRPYENTLSQEILLKDGVVGADDGDDDDDDESYDSLQVYGDDVVQPFANPKEIESRKEEIGARVTVEKLSKVVRLPDSAFRTSEDESRNGSAQQEKKGADDKVGVETKEGKNAEKAHEKVDDKNDDENGEADRDHPSKLVCPGSPSFRIYCQPQKNEGKNKSKEPLKPMPALAHHKSASADSVQSAASANSAYSIQSIQSISKRRHKKKKFGPVKNLIGVKSCYQPSCTRPGESVRNRLRVEKAVH